MPVEQMSYVHTAICDYTHIDQVIAVGFGNQCHYKGNFNPTEHFVILEPRMPAIDVNEQHNISAIVRFEAFKL